MAYEKSELHALVKQVMSLRDTEEFAHLLSESIAEEKRKRQEFYDLIHEDVKAEFIDGEIVMHSPTRLEHLMASSQISYELTAHVLRERLGRVFVEKAMVKLTHSDFEPDICFFDTDQVEEFSQGQLLFPPPRLAIEILSDSTSYIDRGKKFHQYAEHGVLEYWIVDPEARTIEQYENREGSFELLRKVGPEGSIPSLAVKGFVLNAARVFEA